MFMELNREIISISTHTLTWSVTRTGSNPVRGTIISTHTLTWSVTLQLWISKRLI